MNRYPYDFLFAMDFLFQSEGGTNIDPVDRGGFTRYGISQKQYPNVNIVQLTKGQARDIYKYDYWLVNKCDKFEKDVATVLFDTSVNCGVGSAARWLQMTLNAKGGQLTVDGHIGDKTIAASKKVTDRVMIMGIVAYRLKRYSSLLQKHPEQKKYIRGWIERVANLILYVL